MESKEESAEDLVARLRAGEPAALKRAYELHRNDVLAVATAVLGPQASGETAWDVLHDVFVGLARNASALNVDTHLRAYLVRAAGNRAKDRLKRRPLESIGEGGPRFATKEPSLSNLIERDEAVEELLRAVAALPEEQRSVVALRVWGDLTFAEIGQVEHISENTAQSRWRYALEKLKRHFDAGVER